MSEARLPPVRPYHPATFIERGVAVPFTTPLLAGTRARPTEKQGLELVIPNPSGGRGVYIMAWSSITALCCPTLHDREFNARIATLVNVTPSAIRRIGRAVAAEGLAGEAAVGAAQAAADIDAGDRLVTNYLLLMGLVEQVRAIPSLQSPSAMVNKVEMERRARLTVDRVASNLGRSTNWVASALEAIADSLTVVGIMEGSATSRLSRLVKLIRQCSDEIADWSGTQSSDDQVAYTQMVCAVAEFTLTLADTALHQARALTNDLVGLLQTWAVDPEKIYRLTGRAEWLLDGWEQICMLWRFATDDAGRRAALSEMAQLIPVLPREVRDWTDLLIDTDISLRLRQLVPLNEDWRSGTKVFEIVERNEHLRAATC